MHRSKTPAGDDDDDDTESKLLYADLDFAEFQAARWVAHDVIVLSSSSSSSSFICSQNNKAWQTNRTVQMLVRPGGKAAKVALVTIS